MFISVSLHVFNGNRSHVIVIENVHTSLLTYIQEQNLRYPEKQSLLV